MKIPFSTQSIQAAFFLRNIDLSNRLSVASLIQKGLSPKLSGTPAILPIPDDAPLEIPRITLTSLDERLICNVAATRIDLIHRDIISNKTVEKNQKEFSENTKKLTRIILEKLSAGLYRLGLVITYKAEPSINGTELLKNKYLNNPKDASVELQVHKLSIEKIKRFRVNNWIRLISKKEAKNIKPFLIVSDINTLQAVKCQMDIKNTEEFFDNAFVLSIKSTINAIS